MYTKCVYFDLDGTIVYDGVSVSKRTIMAIQYLKSKGIKVGIATGRNLYFTDYFSKLLDVDLPIVCNSGAWIVSPGDFSTISIKFINSKAQFDLLNKFRKAKIDFLVYTVLGVYATNQNLPFYQKLLFVDTQNKTQKTKSIFPYEMCVKDKWQFYLNQKLLKVLICFKDVHQKIEYEKILKTIPDINYSISQTGLIDIYSNEVDKAFAIESVINNLPVSKHEVMVFGDNENDINMLKTFNFLSVALKNAEYCVRKEAKYVTDFTCKQEGVADFIFKNF